MFDPRQETLAFRIWAFAKPRGWNVTCKEIAENLEVTYQSVGHVLRMKGWSDRVRVTTAAERPTVNPFIWNIGF